MKYVLVSDNHGDHDIVKEIRRVHLDADYFIHCGDSESVEGDPRYEGYQMVAGNCDWGSHFPDELILKEGIYVTHGHLCQVKMNRLALAKIAKEKGCRLAFYGHTHILNIEQIYGVYCINPGSIRLPKGLYSDLKTYAVVNIEGNHLSLQYYDQNHRPVEELAFQMDLGH